MNLAERINTIIKVNQLTASEFAEKIGVQRSSVSHILNGRNKPSIDFIEKVLQHFPRVDAGWLLTGKAAPRQPEVGPPLFSEPQKSMQEESGGHKRPALQATGKIENGKTIERIVIFYSDRTFETYDS